MHALFLDLLHDNIATSTNESESDETHIFVD